MHGSLARSLRGAAAVLAMAAPCAVMAAPRAAAATVPEPGVAAPAGHVILVGIGGLRWSDVSPSATPVLWRLAAGGSAGSLVVSGVTSRTCPADGWLTLNSGARSAVPHAATGPCPGPPLVLLPAALGPVPAFVPDMRRLVAYNRQFHYHPLWGLLARAPGPGGCATAAGPGAALALAGPAGQVPSYLPSPARLTAGMLAGCRLTVADLGSLPDDGSPHAARAAAVAAADRRLGAIIARMPPRAMLMVFSPGDGVQPHLRVIVVHGPGYRDGLLRSASARQPGMAVLTDVTPTVSQWLGTAVPPAAVGSVLTATGRAGLPTTVSALLAQDTAAGVYRATVTPFYQLIGFGYVALFALIWLIPRGRGRRRAVARAAGVTAAAVPAGTFLASLVPWRTMPHPAAVLYSLTAVWAVVVAVAALAGPWRRDPLGPPGVVGAVTAGVIGLDMMTGSRLAQETPFGLSVLEAGRFYGLGNNALVIYAAAGLLCAAWLGGAALRQGQRQRALAVIAAVAVFVVAAAGWPGFGAKVGGTIAMVPGFLVLLAGAAGIRVSARRLLLAVASGVALVVVFALADYVLAPAGHSDIGGFVSQSLHGGAGDILARKLSSNARSLVANPFVPVIPVVVAALGVIVGWPQRVRARLLVRAYQQIPLAKPVFSAIWLVAVLGWFAEDSGVTVPAAALPLVLPLAVAIVSSLAPEPDWRRAEPSPAIVDVRPSSSRGGD